MWAYGFHRSFRLVHCFSLASVANEPGFAVCHWCSPSPCSPLSSMDTFCLVGATVPACPAAKCFLGFKAPCARKDAPPQSERHRSPMTTHQLPKTELGPVSARIETRHFAVGPVAVCVSRPRRASVSETLSGPISVSLRVSLARPLQPASGIGDAQRVSFADRGSSGCAPVSNTATKGSDVC
jgi:hypothetical protein